MKKVLILAGLCLSAGLTSAIASASDDLIIATGAEGGGYEAMGRALGQSINQAGKKKDVEFDVEVLNSTGSGENIELFDEGTANMMIVQSDALNVMPPTRPYKAKRAGQETVWWLYNTKHKMSDLEDIEGKSDKVSMVLIDGSGAAYTMRNFAQEDSGYKKNVENAILADDLYDAMDIVCEGKSGSHKVAGLLYVGSSLPKEVRQDFAGCVSVGEATDSDFNDAKDVNGEKLYQGCSIASNRYSPLSGSSSFGKEDTVCVSAMVVYAKDFEEREQLKAVKKGVNKVVRNYR